MGPFDVIKNISEKKIDSTTEEDFDSAYIPFLINRGLSFFVDTLFYVNDMNLNSHLTKKQQHDYLFHSIKPKKRYAKWPKKASEDENLELVKQYFGYNNEKAKAACHLLNETQIIKIKETFIKGGIVK